MSVESSTQGQAHSNPLSRYLPFLEWMPKYRRRQLPGDLVAGAIVAVMLIPQGMAYAVLAGLPPIVGLYTGILPVLIYGLLGSARILTLGPTAITSVMVLSTIAPLAEQGTEQYLALAVTLAFTLGIIFILMGTLRLGFIVNLLSQPVLTGYVTAAALLIAFSQVQHFTGIAIERTPYPHELLLRPLEQIDKLNPITLLIGIGGVFIILFFKGPLKQPLDKLPMRRAIRFSITRSGPLVAILISTALVYFFKLDETAGVAIVGSIPAGFPKIELGPVDLSSIRDVLPGAAAIAFVGFMEGVSTAKSLMTRRRQTLNANQELIAMGVANLTAVVSGGFACTTSISRSSVNHAAGANTGLSSIFAAIFVALTVMFFTPFFYYLPQATLAAIIFSSVINLINFSPVRQIWRYNRLETLPFLATFIGAFFVSIEAGLFSGIIIASILYIWRTSQPSIVELGRMDYGQHYRDIRRAEAQSIHGVVIIRVDESLYFANAQYLERELRNTVAEHPEVEHLILVFSSINSIDASALQILTELIHEFSEAGIEVYISELKQRVRHRLERVKFVSQVGENRFFTTTHEAVKATGHLPDEILPI